MGESRSGKTQVPDVISASIAGDEVFWERVREGVMENSLECDLILKHVRTGLLLRVGSEPNFEDLGQAEEMSGDQVDNSKYVGAGLGCFISYKLIWRKLELNIKFNLWYFKH